MLFFVIRLILTLLAILVFRLTLGPRIAISGVQPDLAAAFVFYLTLVRGPVMGILTGFTLGLLIDVDRPEGIGLSSLAWSTMAYLTARFASAVDMGDRILSSAALFLLVVFAETVRALVISGLDPGRLGMIWVRWVLPTGLYTALFVPLLIVAIHWVLAESRWLRGRS